MLEQFNRLIEENYEYPISVFRQTNRKSVSDENGTIFSFLSKNELENRASHCLFRDTHYNLWITANYEARLGNGNYMITSESQFPIMLEVNTFTVTTKEHILQMAEKYFLSYNVIFNQIYSLRMCDFNIETQYIKLQRASYGTLKEEMNFSYN
jgi:hypothetical protein